MLPPREDRHRRCRSAFTAPDEDRGHRHGSGRLDDELRALHQHEDGAGDVVLGDGDDLVDGVADDLEVERRPAGTRRCRRRSSARSECSTGCPAASETRVGAAFAACTPMMRTVRPCGAATAVGSRCATPETSPPPPIGTIDGVDIRNLLEDLEAEGALARDDVGVVERRDEHGTGLGGERPRPPRGSRRSRCRAARRRRRSRGSPASLGRATPTGMKMVAWMPSSRAARATPCAWLPADAATTPRARSSSLSDERRLNAPRIL